MPNELKGSTNEPDTTATANAELPDDGIERSLLKTSETPPSFAPNRLKRGKWCTEKRYR